MLAILHSEIKPYSRPSRTTVKPSFPSNSEGGSWRHLLAASYNSREPPVIGRVKIPSPIVIDRQESALSPQLKELSGASGIYLLSVDGTPPHLSWSANLGRRLKRLLTSPYTGSNGALGKITDHLSSVECWITGSRLETSLIMAALARQFFPEDYLRRVRLRMPWFVALTSDSSLARLVVLNRLPKLEAVYGPFQGRDAAQMYQQELLGLFQIRRCTERLEPHPGHPGCMYGEMNLCMRPCQTAVSPAEYAHEAQRVRDFLFTNGRTAVSALTTARDRACETTDFEYAAELHKRMERVKAVVGLRDEVIGPARQFNGVALTPGSGKRKLKLWPMLEGYWQDPIVLDFATGEARAKSLDHELRERLAEAVANRIADGKRVEDLALFSRWYYSSWRDGDWFAFRTLDDLNYRRLVRAISNMLKAASNAC